MSFREKYSTACLDFMIKNRVKSNIVIGDRVAVHRLHGKYRVDKSWCTGGRKKVVMSVHYEGI